MKPQAALTLFELFLAQRGLNRANLVPKQGVPAMLEFYKNERADGCRFEKDGDMLLFQWGVHNWGKGEFFDLNITRQLILEDRCEDDDIWQLRLTFKYAPTRELRSLPRV